MTEAQPVQCVLPVSDLLKNGVCHIELPFHLLVGFMIFSGWWLNNADDNEEERLSTMDMRRYKSRAEILKDYRDLIVSKVGDMVSKKYGTSLERVDAGVHRVNFETNHWHYDPKSDGPMDGYRIQSIFVFPEPHQQTVCMPWAGGPGGYPVQAPPGHATVFFNQIILHRGDMHHPEIPRGVAWIRMKFR